MHLTDLCSVPKMARYLAKEKVDLKEWSSVLKRVLNLAREKVHSTDFGKETELSMVHLTEKLTPKEEMRALMKALRMELNWESQKALMLVLMSEMVKA